MLATVVDDAEHTAEPQTMKSGAQLPGVGNAEAVAQEPQPQEPIEGNKDEQPPAEDEAKPAEDYEQLAEESPEEEGAADDAGEGAVEELQEGIDAFPGIMDAGRKAFTLHNWESAVQLFGRAAEIV